AFILLFTKKKKNKDVACILVGLGVLFFGMNAMEGVFAPLKESDKFQQLFISFNNPLLGILIGLVLTAIIQSSSASVGILQAISSTGVVTYGTAIPIIIGMNIGKCMTILLGGIGANKKAKRVSASYLLFNLFGAVFFVILVYGIQLIIPLSFMDKVINRGGIANIHFLFNFITSLILLPFSSVMANVTGKIFKDDEESKIDKELATLDTRLLDTPTIAIAQCRKVMFSMTDAIKENFDIGCRLLTNYNDADASILLENEEFIDKCESELNAYLLKITSKELTKSDRRLASELLNSISDLERIGDHCETLLNVSKNLEDERITFSEQGTEEIHIALKATANIIDTTFTAFKNDDLQAVSRIEPLAQTIDEVKELIKDHHVIRLQTGECGIAGGFALVDILTSLERIGSHCSNIGLHIAKKISTEHIDEMHGHIYTNGYKTSEEYKALYCYYISLYAAPIVEAYGNKIQEIETKITDKVKATKAKDDKSKSDKDKAKVSVKNDDNISKSKSEKLKNKDKKNPKKK
ncbi:MAG: Na/Pi cotransporter family protein, partial [Coprococcus sp.]